MAAKESATVKSLENVLECLMLWPSPSFIDGRVSVPTHCLYTSGSVVRVFVEGASNTFVVHDDGGAIEQFSAAGAEARSAATALRSHFREHGLTVAPNGSICSPAVSCSELAPAVALVANASKDAEAFLLSRWKPKVRRNFKKMLRTLLEQEFPHLHPEFRLLGSSQKQHTFDFAVDRSRGGLVLLDAVHNDANAISSAIARNVDVSRLVRHEIEQRIVYDDEEEWRAEDLNLLSLGAKVIPLSQASAIVAKLAA